MPEAGGLADVLTLMLGDDVAVVPSAERCEEADHHGVFVNAAGDVVARVSCALPTAAALGCALSMIPPAGAEGMVEDQGLSPGASANFYEVMNMLSSLFMDDRSSHLKLTAVQTGAAPQLSTASERSGAYSLDLGRYGHGLLDFHV